MKKCYPIELVNRVANKYQDCWNIVEDFRNDSTLPCWDKRCYIPIAAGLAIAADGDMSKKAILELIIRSRSNSGDCCMEIA